jgi:UDP-2,3-diacylglucosamine pyrophosphatase LpxH
MTMENRMLFRLVACAALLGAMARPTLAESKRPIFFISDLHFGPGHDPAAATVWDHYEDFRWTADFAAFLDELHRRGGGHAELVLNGDTFELWQSRVADCVAAHDLDASCTEAEALTRMRRVLAEHRADLRLLADFASRDDNHVTIVPGNHDVALLFPAVREALMAALGVPASRVGFVPDGVWHTDDGRVVAEHGHQLGEDVNRFAAWPKPFVVVGGVQRLQRPWGEQFVQAFYNQYELLYPIIDNLSSEMAGVRYGLSAAGPGAGTRAVGRFLKFIVLQESRDQVSALLTTPPAGSGGVPDWDYAAIRGRKEKFLIESLAVDDPLRGVATAALAGGELDPSTGALSDADIAEVCAYRQLQVSRGLTVATCPRQTLGGESDTLGSIAHSLLVRRNALFRKRFASLGEPVRVKAFVYSHTHNADAFDITSPNVHVVNTGAWQRLVTPARLKALAGTSGVATAFRQMTPDSLDPCYTFVQIDPYVDDPRPQLRTWEKGPGGWTVRGRCQ